MQLKKGVVRKRLQAQLDRLEARKREYEDSFAAYKALRVAETRQYAEALQQAESWHDFHRVERPYTYPPSFDERYYEDQRKRVMRNMAILDALEGETIDIVAFKTGRGINLETMFDDGE